MRDIKHISLNVEEEIKKILPITLEKDLQDDEIICPACHGLGILKQDYRFGVKEDDTEKNRFKHLAMLDQNMKRT